MLIPIRTVARSVDDTDLSDLTTAKRTGPAMWTENGLEIPFSRTLTDSEVAAITRRLTSADGAEEQLRAVLTSSSTTSDTAALLRALAQMVLRLSDRTPPPSND